MSFIDDAGIPLPSLEQCDPSKARTFSLFVGPLGDERAVGTLVASSWEALWPALWWWLNGDASGIGTTIGTIADDAIVTIRCDGETRWVAVVRLAHGRAGFIEFPEVVRKKFSGACIPRTPPAPPPSDWAYVMRWDQEIRMRPPSPAEVVTYLMDCQLRDELCYYCVLDEDGHWCPDVGTAQRRKEHRPK